MYRFIRVSFAYAYFGNPVVSQGSVDIKEGDSWKVKGFEISQDHRFIFVEPINGANNKPMHCEVYFKPTRLTRFTNWLTGKPVSRLPHRSITSKTCFKLDQIYSVTSYDGYDDCTHGFREITAAEFIPDNRTRRIFDDKQITSPDQLVRGKVIIYHGWNSHHQCTVPEKMVILEGQFIDSVLGIPHFKGLFLRQDGNWEFHPSLEHTTVAPSSIGYYGNLTYLTDTGETMTEDQITVALSHKLPRK